MNMQSHDKLIIIVCIAALSAIWKVRTIHIVPIAIFTDMRSPLHWVWIFENALFLETLVIWYACIYLANYYFIHSFITLCMHYLGKLMHICIYCIMHIFICHHNSMNINTFWHKCSSIHQYHHMHIFIRHIHSSIHHMHVFICCIQPCAFIFLSFFLPMNVPRSNYFWIPTIEKIFYYLYVCTNFLIGWICFPGREVQETRALFRGWEHKGRICIELICIGL